MASDILPIQLSLTEGDVVTLWAPRWREDGEEWEAFLGDDDGLFAFPDAAHLAAFVRTATEHDLIDHPAWPVVPDLTVGELTPDDTQTYDIVGVPELVAEDLDTWVLGELAEVVDMLRSLADVCDLSAVDDVLDSAPAFSMLTQGTVPFVGREGKRLWDELVETVAARWDEVVDALDAAVSTPEVDADALAAAQRQAAAERVADDRADGDATPGDDTEDESDGPSDTDPDTVLLTKGGPSGTRALPVVSASPDDDEADDEPVGFWEEVGIDPIRISHADGDWVTLRCYLDDRPVFLGRDGRIEVFPTERALARWLADGTEGGAAEHDLTAASTWSQVAEAATVGELEVVVDDLNAYVLTGLDADLAEGTLAVDPVQLDLAVELVRDVGEWAGDEQPRRALAESEPLGWLVSFIIKPDPTRLAPSPPFAVESAAFRELIDELVARLQTH